MIAITGLGAVSAYGLGAETLWDGLLSGRSAVGGPARVGGTWATAQVPEPHRGLTSALAVAVARQATAQLADLASLAVVGASTSGDMVAGEAAYGQLLLDGAPQHPSELLWPQRCHTPAQAVSRALGAGGVALSVSTACTSGTVALGVARDLILAGRAERVLVVGADALCQTTVYGFGSLGAQDEQPCRPFDQERAGMNLGEGAGALLLEHPDAVGGRRVLGWLAGYGNTSDAQHLTAPDPQAEAPSRAIFAAIGACDAAQVGFVSAHATGTLLNDPMEALALRRTVPQAWVTGIKGAIGHTLGAAGTLEAIVALLALQRQLAPGTIGLQTPMDGVRASSAPRPLQTEWAISVNFAFGGHNAAVLLRRGEA